MRIGLISDTHIPDHADELPKQLKDAFYGVELILHVGDIYTVPVLDELELIAPVLAAEGDDDPYTTASDQRVKIRHVLNIDGTTIWLQHQRPWSWPTDSKEAPDVIVCGHAHSTTVKNLDGDILLVNPGSATFPHYKHELGTVALLTVNSGGSEARIIQLQNI